MLLELFKPSKDNDIVVVLITTAVVDVLSRIRSRVVSITSELLVANAADMLFHCFLFLLVVLFTRLIIPKA
mgnify:CR=1 FL=1